MNLLYFSGACSMAPHVVLKEAQIPCTLTAIDGELRTSDGRDYREINPKGYIPALELDDGSVLTECAAILQFLADLRPESRLAPPAGTPGRYRLAEWLNFVATEIHKSFNLLWKPETPADWKKAAREGIGERLGYTARHLDRVPFLLGERFTIADAYLWVMLHWTSLPFMEIELDRWPTLVRYRNDISTRPSVREVLQAEGAG